MQIANQVFDKRQRAGISSLIRGLLPNTVPVARYSAKIKEKLNKSGIDMDRSEIHQLIYRASNNQEVYRAAFQILEKERPGQLRKLFNGHCDDHLFDLESTAITWFSPTEA